MMDPAITFTDDDLKRLKENIHKPHEGCSLENTLENISNYDILALLARLEAAEKVCENVNKYLRDPRSFYGMLYAWRKSARKSDER